MASIPVPCLYAITDEQLISVNYLNTAVEQALLGGAKIIQYRAKQIPWELRLSQARAISRLCKKHSAFLIINDDLELSLSVNAAGVHLGREDRSILIARAQLPKTAIIGVTCHSDIAYAVAAEQAGADYVAFGRFFPSATKPTAPAASLAILREARSQISIPIVAIGGIQPEQVPYVREAGADIIAAVQGIFGQADIMAATQRYIAHL